MHYQRIVGKIGVDSPGGWIAIVNGETGKVLVQSMRYEDGRQYPDGANVEIWTNGLGTLSAYGRTVQMPESIDENPYLIESELLGPLTTLDPGESASLTYDWFAGMIGVKLDGAHRIIGCSNVGCVARPFLVSWDGQMSGHFGCFCEGYAAVEFVDKAGHLVEPPRVVARASMSAPLQLSGDVCAPKGVVKITLAIYRTLADAHTHRVTGRLGEFGTVVL